MTAVDMFCGGGGFSEAYYQACERIGARPRLVGINHWSVAIETHSKNHPSAELYCESLDSITPNKVVRGRLDLLIASPECTHHSVARGGRPINDQSRATAWHVLRWADALRPLTVIVENVREFQTWGPLGFNGRPLKHRAGETFRAFIQALVSLGYAVQYRVLNCADYGDATTRERLFIIARRGRKSPGYPQSTHSQNPGLFDELPWKSAREVIDWTIRGRSVTERKRPLADKTLARIEAGIKRYWGDWAEPFLVVLRGTGCARSIERPLPTIAAEGQQRNLVEPMILGQQSGAVCRAVSQPLPTISTSGAVSLVEPFLVEYYGNGSARSIREPVGTITTRDRFALVEAGLLDITFRMLQPHELAAAMSFPSGYKFSGTKTDITRQIGNAVPVRTARALIETMLRTAA